VVLIGGGTGMVGDPSGRTDMRKIMDVETVDYNCAQFKKLFERFLDFDDEWKYEGNGGVYQPGHENKKPEAGKAISVNNGEWIRPLNFLEFVREIGSQFNVNTMLRSEAFKQRMARESGLTFFEFSYMLMQSYDFMVMARDFDVKIEFGGDDQWSNIIGGVELIRRKTGKEAYGLTFKLLLTSEGKKMGKTEKGALWLDAEKTSPYDFYQYWRNIDDADVINCMKMLTFMPLEEIAEYEKLEGSDINRAKERLAYEVTAIIHGETEAKTAQDAARSVFAAGASSENMPTTELSDGDFTDGKIFVSDVLVKAGLCPSKGEAKRTIQQGGVIVADVKVDRFDATIAKDEIGDGIIIKKGKKTYHRIVLG
ncbi:MAG: tyrosine--tRNA ligase, partial [Clostridia bacterium]|nr:tyrosine--tRNA ligase [Clostridia bacterium]